MIRRMAGWLLAPLAALALVTAAPVRATPAPPGEVPVLATTTTFAAGVYGWNWWRSCSSTTCLYVGTGVQYDPVHVGNNGPRPYAQGIANVWCTNASTGVIIACGYVDTNYVWLHLAYGSGGFLSESYSCGIGGAWRCPTRKITELYTGWANVHRLDNPYQSEETAFWIEAADGSIGWKPDGYSDAVFFDVP